MVNESQSPLGEERATILVVDDEPANIDVLRGILSPTYRVKAATSGAKALEIIEGSHPPHLILLDVMMPEMSGHDVLRSLRNRKKPIDIPVIFVTAMGDEADETAGLQLGAVDYITKPVSPALVIARVAAQLRLMHAREKHAHLAKQLSKYLSPGVWQSLFEGKSRAELGSRRKLLSVFFSDIVAFTSRTDHLDPEQLSVLLNEYLDRMTTIALKHGGTVDKFIGDAVMVFFGDPETRGPELDAVACASMALEMQKVTSELAHKWEGTGDEPFSARMGIATGYCTVGNFGSSERMDYTIIGNTVNLASRLEGLAEPGTVYVSGETWKLLEAHFCGVAQGLIEVKGFDAPVPVFRLEQPGTGRVVQGQGEGYRLRIDVDSLDEPGRAELRQVLQNALDALKP